MNELEQLRKFVEWDEQNNPHPEGHKHIGRWAIERIEQLEAERDAIKTQRRILWDAAWAATRSLPEDAAQKLHDAMQDSCLAAPPPPKETTETAIGATVPGSRKP